MASPFIIIIIPRSYDSKWSSLSGSSIAAEVESRKLKPAGAHAHLSTSTRPVRLITRLGLTLFLISILHRSWLHLQLASSKSAMLVPVARGCCVLLSKIARALFPGGSHNHQCNLIAQCLSCRKKKSRKPSSRAVYVSRRDRRPCYAIPTSKKKKEKIPMK